MRQRIIDNNNFWSFFVIFGLFFSIEYLLMINITKVYLLDFRLLLAGFGYFLFITVIAQQTKYIYKYFYVFIIFSSFIFFIVVLLNPLGNIVFSRGDEYMYKIYYLNPSLKYRRLTSSLYVLWLKFWAKFINWHFFKLVNIASYVISIIIFYITFKYVYGKTISKLVTIFMLISPLGIWFSNTYYKEAFYILLLSILMYSISKRFLIFSLLALTLLSFIRTSSVVFIVPLIYYFWKCSRVNHQKGTIITFVSIMFFIILSFTILHVYYHNILEVMPKTVIARGIYYRNFQQNIYGNLLYFFLSLILAVLLPLPYLFVSKESIYYLLDYVGYFEGLLTLVMYPYFIVFIVNVLKLSKFRKQHFLSNESSVFTIMLVIMYIEIYFSIGLSGYIFTYRHYTAYRWIFYLFASIGKVYFSKNSQKFQKHKLIGTFIILLAIIFVNVYRSFYPRI
ncbi:hypothetical protein BG95_04155 [Thermosipho sp. 1063]|uniref:hypothetical protein n=1 Tax=Thermosipho sp. 1063 TaxID=1462747 RepID=UPI000950739F|nr:hypothetical protein [Thermosipho sp. 1063]APT73028.1 hypothetical protein BG95_04155 [Thermosipho sp. 1063]